MSVSFKDYKKNRGSELKRLQADVEKGANPTSQTFEKDADDWYPAVDKSGVGHARIRFLPGPIIEGENESEHKDFVHYFTHEFEYKPTGNWYIENCRTTLKDEPDPVADYNKILWNVSSDETSPEKNQARDQKRKLNYRANVFVLADSVNPENNGKVKKFKFGATIYNFIKEALAPRVIPGIDPEPVLNPFDLIDGANFSVVIYTEVNKGRKDRKYDKSKFEARGPLGSDALMEKVFNEINSDPKWSLKAYIDPSKFKTYEVLKKRLDKVLGFDFEELGKAEKPSAAPKARSTPKVADKAPEASSAAPVDQSQTDNDFFASLTSET